MSIISDILIAIPIGTLYYFFVDSLLNNFYDDNTTEHVIVFIISIVGIILSFTLFKNNRTLKNRSIQFGLILGSSLLFFYHIVCKWNNICSNTKIILFSISLCILVWYSYNYNSYDD